MEFLKTPAGKKHRDYLLLRAAGATGEGHSAHIKEERYNRNEIENQPAKDYQTGRPGEILMFATGTDTRRARGEGIPPPLPRQPTRSKAGRRKLNPIAKESPKLMFAARQPEITATLRRSTSFEMLLGKRQGWALGLCWWDSSVPFRQLHLATGAGKTLCYSLSLLAAPQKRALIVVSLSRAQLEGTRQDLLDLYEQKRPDLKVLIVRPSNIKVVLGELGSFTETGLLEDPVVLLLCLESLDEFSAYGREAALINRMIMQLSEAGLIEQVVCDESHAFELSPSTQDFRRALRHFPVWLAAIVGDSLEGMRAPLTLVTGTPGGRETQLAFWKSMLPGCFRDGVDNFDSCVRTVAQDPCRFNVSLDVKNWDSQCDDEWQYGLHLELLHLGVSPVHAKSASVFVGEMVLRGALVVPANQPPYLTCNVLICTPSVGAVQAVETALRHLGLAEQSIHPDWAGREDEDGFSGLATFRNAVNSVCISTTR